MLGISMAALNSSPGLAQDAAEGADTGETIIVTGTRRADRSIADSPVPVDVIGSDAISTAGQTETNKILNTLVPSFNFPQPSIADGTDALRPATLRGLSPDQTLVLINGKRRHVSALLNINGTVGRGSAAVDLNTIPGLAIERIEVLRDGASSQYGSDAIAGVINIQLKKASSGGRVTASYGKYITTLDDVANITGLQSAAGQPIFDPTDGRVLAANASGERKARDGENWTIGANIGLPMGSSMSPPSIATAIRPTARGSTCVPITTAPHRRRSTRASLASTGFSSNMAMPRPRISTSSSTPEFLSVRFGSCSASPPLASAMAFRRQTGVSRARRPTATGRRSHLQPHPMRQISRR
jgi:outer membrane receptor for ferrienterochelin and colicin